MPLISLILTIIAVGVLLWLADRYIPMDATLRMIMRAVVIIALVLWILQVFGLLASVTAVRVGPVH